jgi:hypothetical protein
MKNNKTVIQLSFKNNMDDKLLLSWLEDKFSEYGNKSNYIKYILRKEMLKESNEFAQKVK